MRLLARIRSGRTRSAATGALAIVQLMSSPREDRRKQRLTSCASADDGSAHRCDGGLVGERTRKTSDVPWSELGREDVSALCHPEMRRVLVNPPTAAYLWNLDPRPASGEG